MHESSTVLYVININAEKGTMFANKFSFNNPLLVFG